MRSRVEEAVSKKAAAAEGRRLQALGKADTVTLRGVRDLEEDAAKLLALDHPPVAPAGEVTEPQGATTRTESRQWIANTLANGDAVAEEASIRRTDLLFQASLKAVALGVDAADSIKAENSLEKMLAHQLAFAHEASMRIMGEAMTNIRPYNRPDSVELTRLTNAAARLMSVYQDGLLTLQRLRSGGNQTVTVQHVHVNEGGQAVIGNVAPGAPDTRGGK
jgi:hypothetical protein